MAKGFSPFLPLTVNNTDGPYRLNKTIPEVAKQNLMMVLLTNPGEKMMDPTFGVGISRFLFESNISSRASLSSEIVGKINQQVNEHLPYITLQTVELLPYPNSENTLLLNLSYTIPGQDEKQFLNLILNNI
tara:strand:- start:49 stop:441 length:393 start_codon:yes stop_codon:yes gene_type:complete